MIEYPVQVTESLLQEITRRIVEGFDPEKVILFGSQASSTSRADSDQAVPDQTGFFCQQADEKYLKAFPIIKERPPLRAGVGPEMLSPGGYDASIAQRADESPAFSRRHFRDIIAAPAQSHLPFPQSVSYNRPILQSVNDAIGT